jgi:hypothetical protein
MSMHRMTAIAAVAVLVAVLASAATAHTGGTGHNHGAGSKVAKRLAKAKRAAARYSSPAKARAAGYEAAPSGCVADPAGSGAMGIHYGNPALLADPEVRARKPEVLLFSPQGRLLGVEYFRADADQDLSTDGDRPERFGRPFDGPMEGHEPGMPRHYDLHVWLFKRNPAGRFAQYNPTVRC